MGYMLSSEKVNEFCDEVMNMMEERKFTMEEVEMFEQRFGLRRKMNNERLEKVKPFVVYREEAQS